MNDVVNWSTEQGVGVITLNRPDKLNALNVELLQELRGAINAAWNDSSVRAVVLAANGRAFSAGADIAMEPEKADPKVADWTSEIHQTIARLYWLPKPVVAAVNGLAYGAGCDLTLAADIRVASTAARFCEAYTGIGFSPDAGGSYLLPKIVGEANAADMIFTGRVVESDEALAMGIVTQVFEPEDLLPKAMERAHLYASGPTVALGLAKQNMRAAYSLTFEQELRNERTAADICERTADSKEGLASKLERRPAHFRGE